MKMGECPLCGESTNKPSTRLIKESCGHSKCRLCLLNEESGCSVCEGSNGDISLNTIESIGNFDYRLPATTISNYEELNTSPRKLDFNKIPDDFHDCPLDEGRLTIDNSITQNSENVMADVPEPEKVDISTETEDIVAEEEEVQVQPVQQNTHSPVSQVMPTPTQPVAKLTEVFANNVKNNHPPQQGTPVVQNANFIPVTQRPDGRQFITIAFIANNSPNKNQHVVTPLLNQCLPTIGNMVQRPAGNQCIPMIGNISTLPNPAGGQFIIRSPNIVQNLIGNQSIPIIGNLNALQNLTGNQHLSMIGNVNAVKTLSGNRPLPSFPTVNALQSPTKSQSFPISGSSNVVQNAVGNQSFSVAQAAPKIAKNQSAPVQDNVNTAKKQVRTRGLPRIKNVKNVNIVQKSLTNQSDKVSSQIEKSPVQAKRGRRQHKELPFYLVPGKPNEKTKTVPAENPTQIISCMSPEYKLEDYLLFNNQEQANNAATKDSEIQTETKATNNTQMINKPSESVINESPIVSDTVMEKKLEENKESEQEDQVLNDKTDNKKNIYDLSVETDECKEHQDLNVIFNIRDEDKQTVNEEISDEKEKLKIPNGETSKEEYQNLDVLFDIIERESKKLNGGIFDKEAQHDLYEENEENQKLHGKIDSGKDANYMSDQTVNIEGEKNEVLNIGISENGESQHLNTGMDYNNTKIETLNKEFSVDKEVSENSHEQKQNLIGELPVENSAIQHLDEEAVSQEEQHKVSNTKMEYEKEESKTLNETKEYQNMNGVFGNIADSSFMNDEIDPQEISQTLDEKVGLTIESTNANGEVSHDTEEDQYIEGEISTHNDNSFDEIKMNGNEEDSQCVNENIDDKEKINQMLYEDISDEENTSGKSSSENHELQFKSGESNVAKDNLDQHFDEKTVEEESQILNEEVDHQNEETNLSSTIETHQEENASLSLDVKQDLPVAETIDLDSNELGVMHQHRQSDVVKKRKGRQKKSLPADVEKSIDKSNRSLPTFEIQNEDYQEKDPSEELSDSCVENKEVKNQCLPATIDEEESQTLGNKVDSNEKDQGKRIETNDEENERLHENTNLNLTKTKSSMVEIPDLIDNAQPIVKKPGGRKKKSLSSYELDSKIEISLQNQQFNVKKPKGRPKKSLLYLEKPDNQQFDSSKEIEHPTSTGFSDLCGKSYYEESQNQHFDDKVDDEESQVLDETAQIHNQKEEYQSSRLDVHNRDEERLGSDVKSNLAMIEKNNPRDEVQASSFENKLEIVMKKPIARPKSKNVLPSFDKQRKPKVSYENEQPIVKKPIGRPKKSLTNLEQSNVVLEAELSITTESLALCEKTTVEEGKEQQFDGTNKQVLDKDVSSQEGTSQHSSLDMGNGSEESLHSNVNTNITLPEKNNPNEQQPDTANENDQLMVIKKARGRPKKSLGSCEQQSESMVSFSGTNIQPSVVKNPRGRPKKSLTNLEQPNVSQEVELPTATEISNQCGTIDDAESKDQHTVEEDSDLNKEVFNKETEHLDITTNLTFIDKNDSGVGQKPKTVNDNEHSTVIKKSRGRPKKSLVSSEQQSEFKVNVTDVHPKIVTKKPRGRPKTPLSSLEQKNERDVTQETDIIIATDISNSCEKINDVQIKYQHTHERSENEENQVRNTEVFNQEETIQNSSMYMDNEEEESPHSNININVILTENNDPSYQQPDNANKNEQSTVIKKPRGRPKKSLSSCEQQIESKVPVFDVNKQPIVVKKSRGRPKTSSSSLKQRSKRDATQETEIAIATAISNLCETIDDVERKDQHIGEGSDGEKNQVLSHREVFNQDETNQNSSMVMDNEEEKSPHSNINTNVTFTEKNNPNEQQPDTANENDQSVVIKKSRGRPKKSLGSCEQQNESMVSVSDTNVQPNVVKKPRGRPKKSLSNIEQPNECDISQEAELLAATEISNQCETINDVESECEHTDEGSGDKKNQVLNRELFNQDETNQNSMNDVDKESLHSGITTSSAFVDKNDSDAGKNSKTVNDNELSGVTKKARGRPRKSLVSCEQQSESMVSVSDTNVQPNVVKKPRGRPKKSLSNIEQPNECDVSQEAELPTATEISNQCETINDMESKYQNTDEGSGNAKNPILIREVFNQGETNQNSMNDVDKESLHSGTTTSSAFVDKNDSDAGENSKTVNDNELSGVMKKARGRPRKSFSSSERHGEPKVCDIDVEPVVIKKPRGRPKKSLPNLEQPIEHDVSQEIEQPLASKMSDLCDENKDEKDQAQCLNESIDTEKNQTLNEEVKGYDETLLTSNISIHTDEDESLNLEAVVNTSCNGNSVDNELDNTRESEQSTVIKKPRGRPKKVIDAAVKKKGRPKKSSYEQHECSDGNMKEQVSQIPFSEFSYREEASQIETYDEDNESFHLYDEEEIDSREREGDLIPNEDVNNKVDPTLSTESDEVSNDEEESKIVHKDTDKEEGSQDLKVQDDENKENKEKYSEKDDAKVESVTSVIEHDLEKPCEADDEITKNNTTGRKYKSFDTINTQVIVENSKRKRKPKVLLYENEDLEISTKKKKKKDVSTLLSKNESRKSMEKAQIISSTDINESSLDSKHGAKSIQIKVKKVHLKSPVQGNKMIESVEKSKELSQNESSPHVDENPVDTEKTESIIPARVSYQKKEDKKNMKGNLSATSSSQKDEDKKSMKRNRRPKILLYENEDLTIAPKSVQKKKVEFTLPTNEDSLDSNSIKNVQKDDSAVNFTSINVKEDNKLEVSTSECETPVIAKKSERVRKPKTLLYENESLTFTPVKEKENLIKSEMENKDLLIMKKFEIKLEPKVVLDRILNLSLIQKYDLDDNIRTAESKKSRGRPKKLEKDQTPLKTPEVKRKKIVKESPVAKKPKGRPRKKENSHIVKVASDPPLYKCTICKESFRTYSISAFHSACVQKPFKCELCPRQFYKATHLQYHERMHKGEKPFACELCGKQFVQKYKLNRHLLIHKYAQNLECNECGKKFASKENLKSHLLSHAQSSFVFGCNHCPKSFTLDSNRKRHELSHSPVALFKCLRCPKSFKSKYEVARHVKTHQKMRPFACHDCSKTFLTKFEVRRHAIIHSGEKKYTCKYCQQQFGRFDNLSRHMLHHHPVTDSLSVQSCSGSPNCSTPEAATDSSSNEEKKQEMRKDQSEVKPKKISRTASNPLPMTISFAQPLTPQSVSSSYSISHNHDLASVIRETLPDLNNAVPVISAPISVQPSSSLIDPIPLEQALVLNRQIEEKIYTQNSFCEFPGLTRRNVTIISRQPSYTFERSSSGSNSNSTDGASFLTVNQERFIEQQEDEKMIATKKDIHVHWRRRTAETLKSKMNQNV